MHQLCLYWWYFWVPWYLIGLSMLIKLSVLMDSTIRTIQLKKSTAKVSYYIPESIQDFNFNLGIQTIMQSIYFRVLLKRTAMHWSKMDSNFFLNVYQNYQISHPINFYVWFNIQHFKLHHYLKAQPEIHSWTDIYTTYVLNCLLCCIYINIYAIFRMRM